MWTKQPDSCLRKCVAAAREVLGVCPQFDVQWDELTALEHLVLYGALKGMHPEAARDEGHRLLARGGRRRADPWGGLRRAAVATASFHAAPVALRVA